MSKKQHKLKLQLKSHQKKKKSKINFNFLITTTICSFNHNSIPSTSIAIHYITTIKSRNMSAANSYMFGLIVSLDYL